MGLFEKNPIFQKSDKGSKFAIECDWNNKFSQNVQVLVFWKKPTGFQKKMIFFKIVKNSKFAEKRDWFSDISQHVTKKKISKTRLVIWKKSWVLVKTAKSSQFGEECNQISKFSLNVQNLGFLLKKIWFLENNLEFLKNRQRQQVWCRMQLK